MYLIYISIGKIYKNNLAKHTGHIHVKIKTKKVHKREKGYLVNDSVIVILSQHNVFNNRIIVRKTKAEIFSGFSYSPRHLKYDFI